ncbi:MAG: prepilin-type N-terminal cleavage/methylation domain-containing protein [Betaproteobacteria bacterium]|nr:prepilin-type N-terminal cleavage/methylation domain-containing protein [Betaproteobacteria bacterium]
MKARSFAHARRETASGFTLVELMIAVVIVALLASIALPSFMDSIRKSRRSEAFAALSAVQQAQERWRGKQRQFVRRVIDLRRQGAAPGWEWRPLATAKSGYYTVSRSWRKRNGLHRHGDGCQVALPRIRRQPQVPPRGVRMAAATSWLCGPPDPPLPDAIRCWAK